MRLSDFPVALTILSSITSFLEAAVSPKLDISVNDSKYNEHIQDSIDLNSDQTLLESSVHVDNSNKQDNNYYNIKFSLFLLNSLLGLQKRNSDHVDNATQGKSTSSMKNVIVYRPPLTDTPQTPTNIAADPKFPLIPLVESYSSLEAHTDLPDDYTETPPIEPLIEPLLPPIDSETTIVQATLVSYSTNNIDSSRQTLNSITSPAAIQTLEAVTGVNSGINTTPSTMRTYYSVYTTPSSSYNKNSIIATNSLSPSAETSAPSSTKTSSQLETPTSSSKKTNSYTKFFTKTPTPATPLQLDPDPFIRTTRFGPTNDLHLFESYRLPNNASVLMVHCTIYLILALFSIIVWT